MVKHIFLILMMCMVFCYNVGFCDTCEGQNPWTEEVDIDCVEDDSSSSISVWSSDITTSQSNLWINMDPECLLYGGCSLDVYKTVWVREDTWKETRTSVLTFFQDLLWSSTFFIGTVVTVAFLASGFLFVWSGMSGNESLRTKARQGIIGSIIGLLLVMSAYALVRLIQYIAMMWW